MAYLLFFVVLLFVSVVVVVVPGFAAEKYIHIENEFLQPFTYKYFEQLLSSIW